MGGRPRHGAVGPTKTTPHGLSRRRLGDSGHAHRLRQVHGGSGPVLHGCRHGGASPTTPPIKALVSEKFFDMVDILGARERGHDHGDSTINTEAPVICCTAEILANQALREGPASKVACVVMDEFHFYADPDRGWAWQVPLLTLPNAQFLLMSATLGDVERHRERPRGAHRAPVDLVTDAPRPVPLSYDYTFETLEATVELGLRAARRRCTSCTSPRTRR